MIKWSIHQEDIAILNVYMPNKWTITHVKQKLTELKGQTDKRTITVENFNTSLSKIDKATRQKISKDIKELTINQQDLIDIYTHSSQNMLQTYPTQIWRWTISWAIEQVSINLKELQFSIFSNPNKIKQETNNRKMIGNSPNTK